MRSLFSLIVILFVVSTTLYSQTLKSIPEKGKGILTSADFNKRLGFNVKAGVAIGEGPIIGFIGELQYYEREELSWVLSISQYFPKGYSFSNVTTAGPKIYFGLKKIQLFLSPGVGLFIFKETDLQWKKFDWEKSLALGYAFGIQYNLNNRNNLNLELKNYLGFTKNKEWSINAFLFSVNIGYGF